MIRIARGPEPEDLRKNRFARLSEAILTMNEVGGTIAQLDLDNGYQPARKRLHDLQRHTCAFCERPSGMSSQPTEHFRPRRGAERRPEPHDASVPSVWDADRYWWLSWTWENLLFSCRSCNDGSHKGNHFALSGAPLPKRSFDISLETPMLVDPTRVDPLDHIQWIPSNPTDPWIMWEWAPRPITPSGAYTLKVFKWIDDDLQVKVTPTIQADIVPHAMAVESARSKAVAWRALSTKLVEGVTFAGARWSALEYIRTRPGSRLSKLPALPRPGRHDAAAPIVGLPEPPVGIPLDAWLRMLAGQDLDGVLLALCGTDRNPRELQELLRSEHSLFCKESKPQIKSRLDALVASGQLNLVPGDRYRVGP